MNSGKIDLRTIKVTQINDDCRSEFERLENLIHPSDKSNRLPNGNYSGYLKQKRWIEFKEQWRLKELSNIILTEDQKQEFIDFIRRWSVDCYFEGDKLIVPSGQGHSVGVVVGVSLEAFKLKQKQLNEVLLNLT